MVVAGIPNVSGAPAIPFMKKLYKVHGFRGAFDVMNVHPYAANATALRQAMQSFQRQANSRNVTLDNRGVQGATYGMVEELLKSKTTLLAMMGLPKPPEMTGHSLVALPRSGRQ